MALRLVFGHEDIFPSIEHLAKALIRQATVFGDRNAAFLVYREEGQVVRGNEVPVEDQQPFFIEHALRRFPSSSHRSEGNNCLNPARRTHPSSY